MLRSLIGVFFSLATLPHLRDLLALTQVNLRRLPMLLVKHFQLTLRRGVFRFALLQIISHPLQRVLFVVVV